MGRAEGPCPLVPDACPFPCPRSGSGRSQEVHSSQREPCGFSPAQGTSLPTGLTCGIPG